MTNENSKAIEIKDRAVTMYEAVMANREALLRAWIAETGVKPSECVMLERQINVENGIQIEVKFEKREFQESKMIKVIDDEKVNSKAIEEMNALIKDVLYNNGDDHITKETYEDMNFSAAWIIEMINRRITALKNQSMIEEGKKILADHKEGFKYLAEK